MFFKLLYNLFTFTIYLYLYRKYISYNFAEISIIKSVLYLILTFILYISINFQYLFISLILILSSILSNTDSKTLDNFVKLENIKYGEKIKNSISNLNNYIINNNNSLFYYYDNIFNYISSKLINYDFYNHNNNELKDNMLNQMKDMIKDINNDIDNLENIKKNIKFELSDISNNENIVLNFEVIKNDKIPDIYYLYGLYSINNKIYKKKSGIAYIPDYNTTLKCKNMFLDKNNVIVECLFYPEKSKWIPIKVSEIQKIHIINNDKRLKIIEENIIDND